MSHAIATISAADFAEAYQAIRDWTMTAYGIRPSELNERAALSLRNIGLVVRRNTFQGFDLAMAPRQMIERLNTYLRTLPDYSFKRSACSQTERSLDAHASTLATPEAQAILLRGAQ